MIDIEPRHGNLHFINIKYGYIVLGISSILILYLLLFKFIYIQQWKRNGIHNKLLTYLQGPPTWFIMLIWTVIIAFLSQDKIHSIFIEYTTVAKRLGRIAYSLVPLNIFLILRFANSPNLNPGYYLQNLNLHKWLSRLIFLLSFIHGLIFAAKWIIEGTGSKFVKFLNLLGIVVILPFTLLIVVSIRYMRRKSYRLFYIVHNITSWSMVILITFHARPGVWPIAILSIVMLALQLYSRLAAYRVNSIKVIDTPTSTLQIVKVPLPLEFPSWSPASHVRINYSFSKIQCWLTATHPFTIASIYEDSRTSLVLIKKKTQLNFDAQSTYLVTGPYCSIPQPLFNTAQVVSIICGGSGLSFGLPIYQYFKTTNPSVEVNLVWCVSNKDDLFILNQLNLSDLQIYVTGVDSQESSSNEPIPPEFVIEGDDEVEHHGLLKENIELQHIVPNPVDPNDIDEGNSTKDDSATNGRRYRLGRPKLDEVFAINNPTITLDPNITWIIACGPDGMINDSKKWAKEHNYQFFSEKYEM
ncbi:AIM14 [Candida margitis]|uniref:AIM14 n=1 Tax=Candida margitis TaxID=1775924 RepID=UPI002226213E|nr:AIM14 [Candida margitis]KAI5954040.1 AIM14 [Candida margitis]